MTYQFQSISRSQHVEELQAKDRTKTNCDLPVNAEDETQRAHL